MMVLVAGYQIVTIACWGRTIGKTVVGTRVVGAVDLSVAMKKSSLMAS